MPLLFYMDSRGNPTSVDDAYFVIVNSLTANKDIDQSDTTSGYQITIATSHYDEDLAIVSRVRNNNPETDDVYGAIKTDCRQVTKLIWALVYHDEDADEIDSYKLETKLQNLSIKSCAWLHGLVDRGRRSSLEVPCSSHVTISPSSEGRFTMELTMKIHFGGEEIVSFSESKDFGEFSEAVKTWRAMYEVVDHEVQKLVEQNWEFISHDN